MILVRGISEGIKDPESLLSMIDITKLKASEDDLKKSLQGIYKQQYITVLKLSLESFDFFKKQMNVYEKLIEEVLIKMLPEDESGNKPVIEKKKGHVRKNQYNINMKSYLQHIKGTDITQVDGMEEITILEIISVTGTDMSKWKTAEHFASWLNLSPRPNISGGKTLGHQKRFTNNKATQAFRMAAQTMWQHKGALGNLYRRLAAQKGSKKAVKAIARKLAVIFYNMMKHKTPYDKSKLESSAEKQEAKKIAYLQKELKKHGYDSQRIIT